MTSAVSSSAHLRDFLAYLAHQRRYSAHTIDAYAQDLAQCADFIAAQFETKGLERATHTMLRAWLLDLAEKGLQARSLNRKLATLRAFYKYLIQFDYIQQNPSLRLRSLKTPKRLSTFVKEDDMRKLLDELHFEDTYEGAQDRAILALLYGAGLRRSELIGLRMADWQKNKDLLRVTGKGNKERLIPLPQSLRHELSAYLAHKERLWGKKAAHEGPFFLTKEGKPLYATMVYRLVRKYLETATYASKKSPHVLRHSYATHLLDRGADLNAIKELLGHSSLSATQIYTHNNLKKLKAIYKQAHPKA